VSLRRSFSYDGIPRVLQTFLFAPSPETVTALVGSSGSGKSNNSGLTFRRFYVPTNGRILVEGTDLSTVRLDTIAPLGVVLQESCCLTDHSMRREGGVRAVQHGRNPACLPALPVEEFDESFADKYRDVVRVSVRENFGRGMHSGFQSLAPFWPEPSILILDEATRAVTPESEQMIRARTSYLMQGGGPDTL